MSNVRTPAIAISAIYLFGPMVFSAPTAEAVSPNISRYSIVEGLGQGGPEAPYILKSEYSAINDKFASVLMPISAYVNPFDPVEEDANKVPVIRVTNYMKVSNTQWPVDTPDVSSDYGWRTPPCDGCSSDHRGVDFVPGENTPVYAVTDGIIVEMNYNSGYGYYVRIKHLVTNNEGELENWETLYAHMATDSIPENLIIGSAVKTGEIIGKVGSTGVSTGPHLHFELLIEGEHVDPFPLLGTYQVLELDEDGLQEYRYAGEIIRSEAKVVGYE